MTWPPPPIDVLDRTNDTAEEGQHPKDHNDLQVAVNTTIDILGEQPQGLFDTVDDRITDAEAIVYTTPTPTTITPTIVHAKHRYPQVEVTDLVSGTRIAAFGCQFPTMETVIITLLSPRMFVVTIT